MFYTSPMEREALFEVGRLFFFSSRRRHTRCGRDWSSDVCSSDLGVDTIKVPEGTQTGTTLRLRGKGMPDVNGRGRGDLFATVQVQTPKKLSKEQRQLLEQLSKALPKEKFEPRPRDETQDERNLFDRVKDMFG